MDLQYWMQKMKRNKNTHWEKEEVMKEQISRQGIFE